MPSTYKRGTSSNLPWAVATVPDDVWSTVEADESSCGGGRLIDTEKLLTASDLLKPENTAPCGEPSAATGEVRKKRACKNCTCGLAKLEAEEAATVAEATSTVGVKSSCGNVSFIIMLYLQFTLT